MDIQAYIQPELGVLIPVLYGIGCALKKWQGIGDRWIPLTLGCIGVFLSALYLLAATPIGEGVAWASFAFAAITQGVLCAAASVYVNQLYLQATQAKRQDAQDAHKEED